MALGIGEPGPREHREHLGGRRAGTPSIGAGRRTRPGRTTARRSAAPRDGSTRRGPRASRGCRARSRRAARRGRPVRTTRASSAKNAAEVHHVAEREPARDAVRGPVAQRKLQDVGLDERSRRRRRRQHPVGEVEPERAISVALQLAYRDPPSRRPGPAPAHRPGSRSSGDRAPAPPRIHPERHDPVHQVVAPEIVSNSDRTARRFSSPSGSGSIASAGHAPRSMPARAARTSSSSPTRSMCDSAVSSSTRRKWCETSCVTAGSSSANATTI